MIYDAVQLNFNLTYMHMHHTHEYYTDFHKVLVSCSCVILFYLLVHKSNTTALELVRKQI